VQRGTAIVTGAPALRKTSILSRTEEKHLYGTTAHVNFLDPLPK
jgi:hypothetical protein